MNPIISRQNVRLYLKQTYHLTEKELFSDDINSDINIREDIIAGLIQEFTSLRCVGNNLITTDPYTKKDMRLPIPDFDKVDSMNSLMALLSETHKQRMQAIATSRARLLENQQEKEEQDIER